MWHRSPVVYYRASRIIWHIWGLTKVSYKPNIILTDDFSYKEIVKDCNIRQMSYYPVSYYPIGPVPSTLYFVKLPFSIFRSKTRRRRTRRTSWCSPARRWRSRCCGRATASRRRGEQSFTRTSRFVVGLGWFRLLGIENQIFFQFSAMESIYNKESILSRFPIDSSSRVFWDSTQRRGASLMTGLSSRAKSWRSRVRTGRSRGKARRPLHR